VAADHWVVLADDETVRIVSPALPGHIGVASPSGRPQLDDGAKCAATHARHNNALMKIIPDSGCLPARAGGALIGRDRLVMARCPADLQQIRLGAVVCRRAVSDSGSGLGAAIRRQLRSDAGQAP
jgi:hypothetical protein